MCESRKEEGEEKGSARRSVHLGCFYATALDIDIEVDPAHLVCVECLIGKQKKPILFKVIEPSSIPYRTHSACAKRAAYPDPPPVTVMRRVPVALVVVASLT